MLYLADHKPSQPELTREDLKLSHLLEYAGVTGVLRLINLHPLYPCYAEQIQWMVW